MIYKKVWLTKKRRGSGVTREVMQVRREGWFLFGVLPLYVRDLNVREWRYG